jgi:hypothetical protein
MKLAYADPPYVGQAKKHYKCEETNQGELIRILQEQAPDGWAISLSVPSLRWILPACPEDARVGAWVKPFASFKPGVNPAYAWEPVIWRGGRQGKARNGGERVPTVRDWVSANITLKKGLSGAKPQQFAEWIYNLLGLETGDTFVEYFPGTAAVGKYVQSRGIETTFSDFWFPTQDEAWRPDAR